MTKKLVLIVGNGLALSYYSHWEARLTGWHPSEPLNWSVPNPSRSSQSLLAALPSLARAIATARSVYAHATDFEVFREVLTWARTQTTDRDERRVREMAEVEARHFLAIAYSHFQQRVLETGPGDWPWMEWFACTAQAALYAVSLNYESLLEHALRAVGRRVTLSEGVEHGTVVFKPHGSIDFDLGVGFVDFPLGYPLHYYAAKNDGTVSLLPHDRLIVPRREPVCVLPTESSYFTGAMWNRNRFREYAAIAPQATHCVIAGISFHEADRIELEYFLDKLHSSAVVNVVDPDPSGGLLEALANRGLRVDVSSLPLLYP